MLDLYDRNDRLTTVIISSTKDSATRLSQAEVNTFLKSLIVDENAPAQLPTSK